MVAAGFAVAPSYVKKLRQTGMRPAYTHAVWDCCKKTRVDLDRVPTMSELAVLLQDLPRGSS